MRMRKQGAWLAGLAMLLAAQGARASEPEAAAAIRVQSIVEPGSGVRWGRAETTFDAPMANVLAVVRDYARYAEFLPHFEKSKVLSQRGGSALVYMQAQIVHGTVTIWAQLRMRVRREGDTEVVEASLMKGNIDRMSARWELSPTADGRTKVAFQMLLDPDLPLPDSLISSENRKATRRTLESLRKRLDR